MTFREWVGKQNWVFAKTYAAFAPHEYVIRGKCFGDDEQFFAACQCILDHGIRMFYYKTERKYLFLDGYFYWIMGDEVNEERKVINRCRPEDYDIVFMRRGTQAKTVQEEQKPKKKKTRFRYGMQRNGFSFGNQPMNGLIEVQESVEYINVLVYNRELSEKEKEDYELVEINDEG